MVAPGLKIDGLSAKGCHLERTIDEVLGEFLVASLQLFGVLCLGSSLESCFECQALILLSKTLFSRS